MLWMESKTQLSIVQSNWRLYESKYLNYISKVKCYERI
ncbi:hypothetical protein PEPMIC_00027 [Parvimonas micra ATCC 33270]|uniref:Uncharacterized protein n=1 Tax=Parvimonas micra ATCC 33270 TaxID=411465 RepID=A8SI65_9FIRM|nr:hypothetical protein PEPMIC_00027 [Parvimonas micra ATCC 33270]